MSEFEIGFVVVLITINSYFSFKAGASSGKWEGIVSTLRFLKEEKALKGKTSIKNFKNWPDPLQKVFINPAEFED